MSPTCCGACAARPDASADLIVAADAMVYVAELTPVLAEAARVLAAGGLFAFTTETHDGEGVVHRPGAALCPRCGLRPRRGRFRRPQIAPLEDPSARNEDNTPVPGLVAVAAKT